MRRSTIPAALAAGLTFALLITVACSKEKKEQGDETVTQEKTTALAAPPAPSKAETRPVTVSGLSFRVPVAWKDVPPSSTMRKAQFRLPPPEGGDLEDGADLVLYFFGPGQGGGVEDNITRWLGQFQAPDGSPLPESAAQREHFQANGLTVSTVRANGSYVAPMMPGAPETHDETGWALYGSIVEGDGGPWFFKATGPQATMDLWEGEIRALFGSLSPADSQA
jgi:hypothetical protein